MIKQNIKILSVCKVSFHLTSINMGSKIQILADQCHCHPKLQFNSSDELY